MEVPKSQGDGTEYKLRSLTPLRILRGVLCLVVLLSTAFLFLVYLAPVAACILRVFNIHLSRKVTSFLFGIWLALWPILFEKINKTKVVFTGDSVPPKERVLIIANHRTEVDWMYLWDLAMRKGSLGSLKYVLKSSLMKLPIFGWAFHIFEFISVERKWEIDEPVLRKMLSTFTDRQDPLWLAVFPEGTDFTEQKCKRSQQFAAENGLPILKYVLLPKSKGFHACLEMLKDSLDAVYDITIAYKHRCPTLSDNVFGVDPSEVHIHIQRILTKDIPTSELGATAWLMDTFKSKDQLLSDFVAQGHFPNQGGSDEELSLTTCLANLLAVICLTGLFVYLTFFSSIWFKVYVCLSCTYLWAATYFNFRPSPVTDVVKNSFLLVKKNC
ncbi:unnamed protein product [Rhodiola kirilowii]